MYSTKLVHKNTVDGNAYITIGDPYFDPKENPFRQGKNTEKIPFRTKMKPVNEENGYFSKSTYKSGGYSESIKYITTQPLESRKKGFGTKDAHRRDEFSNTNRTEQYRETLRKETELMNQRSGHLQEELEELMKSRATSAPIFDNTISSDSADFSYDSHVSSYDIGRTRNTPFDPRGIKDTFYKFNSTRDKRLGLFRASSSDIGNDAWNIAYKPPSHGGKSEVRNFFDKSHLSVHAD